METAEKRDRYLALVAERKACGVCAGLRNPASPELATFDSDAIGPWSRLHGDLEAHLMIVGQDWGDVDYYVENSGLDDPSNPTNRTLEQLLNSIGLDVSLHSASEPRGVFLTNAILCLKQGGLQSPVERTWFTNCGERFLRAQIEIVSPRVVVAMGQRAYKAVMAGFGLRAGAFRAAVESELGAHLSNGSMLMPVYHCGRRILNTHRGLEAQFRDWRRVAQALREAGASEWRSNPR
jgi:DNA polymerase